jgi:Flp pilus assembly pilin Flp
MVRLKHMQPARMGSALRYHREGESQTKGKSGMPERIQHLRRLITARFFFARDETGATSVEYAVMVGLIAAIIIFTVQVLGEETNNAFQSVLDAWP